MFTFLEKIFGNESEKTIKALKPKVEEINSLESSFAELKDDEIQDKTNEFKNRIKKGETLSDILPEAFALVREVAKRTLDQRHYDVQLIGGMVMHQGKISEMKTGEGKTLAATLPAYLNALSGESVHIVTVNDYLAKRDAASMGQIYKTLGLSVGVINSQNTSFVYDEYHTKAAQDEETDKDRDRLGDYKVFYEYLRPVDRKEAYQSDVVYGTNNEFGFDYLRDNLAAEKDQLTQRGHHFAIIDEIDSILIDEARTPLIISGQAKESESLYVNFARIAAGLKEGEDYIVDEKLKAVSLTEEGISKAERSLGLDNIYTDQNMKNVHHLETAVRAKALRKKDKDYVVQDGQIIIVDESTGRLMPGRRWSEGLHQAVEAKEGVKIEKETQTLASVTFQNYFRMYEKLSGMTGTATTSQEEFRKVYELEVVEVPTNLPSQRIDKQDLIFRTEKGKFKAITNKIKELNEKGQPVLIGTASIEKNELLSAYLNKAGINHQVLNAKAHEQEGAIIAQAGRKGSVVVATNMAGRGIDIKLGGAEANQEEYEQVKELGGLFVLGTERHEARRIDNQLRGRAGRQGDPGQTQFFVSLEDDLMRVFGSDGMKNMMQRLGVAEDQPIENRFISRAIENAQSKIEGFNFDARKHVLKFDDVLNHQRQTIYKKRKKILLGDKKHLQELIDELSLENDKAKNVIEGKKSEFGEDKFLEVFRKVALHTINTLWMEHLEVMDHTRQSVNLRAYGQKDPLVEYKREGLRLFREMQDSIKENIISHLENIKTEAPIEVSSASDEFSNITEGRGQNSTTSNDGLRQNVDVREGEKIGRNDPCPCGATKKDGTPIKYKNCHGK